MFEEQLRRVKEPEVRENILSKFSSISEATVSLGRDGQFEIESLTGGDPLFEDLCQFFDIPYDEFNIVWHFDPTNSPHKKEIMEYLLAQCRQDKYGYIIVFEKNASSKAFMNIVELIGLNQYLLKAVKAIEEKIAEGNFRPSL